VHRACGRDGAVELLLDDRLDARVDAGHQRSAGCRGDRLLIAGGPSLGVDAHARGSRHAAKGTVVAALETRAAHQRAAVESVDTVILGLGELAGGDRSQVAEQMRGVDAEASRVRAHAALFDDHRRVVLGLLLQRDRDVLGHVFLDGHRLER
jgi:hypothetical protein